MVKVSGSFTDMQNWSGGIRRQQATDAFDSPDASTMVTVGDNEAVSLVTKRVEHPRPHVMLLIAAESPLMPLTIGSGYRLYGTPEEIETWRLSPRGALHELITRYGLEFTTGEGATQRYLEDAHVDEFEFLFPDREQLTAETWVRKDPAGGFDVALAWVIDETAYRAAEK